MVCVASVDEDELPVTGALEAQEGSRAAVMTSGEDVQKTGLKTSLFEGGEARPWRARKLPRLHLRHLLAAANTHI